ncbi:hypothetical protein SAMN05428976_1193 [Clostridium sp. USBA 49]|uniref:hypothetical protein n=1 Tax=Clostridium sp. USBA 49 TaxID=1881060 RepID=UPI00099A35C1|nr:hypothetical protein [Clostridium sp. USBA 49]SKA92150.1 hypothetical protein SAMN05428976_1193 [Clostridium sp. USBA 49]
MRSGKRLITIGITTVILIICIVLFNFFKDNKYNSKYNSKNFFGIVTSDDKKTYMQVIDLDKKQSIYKSKLGSTDEYFYSEILYDKQKNIIITTNSNSQSKDIYSISNNEVKKLGSLKDAVSSFKLINNDLYAIKYIKNKGKLVHYDINTLNEIENEIDIDGYIVDLTVSDNKEIYILSILDKKTYLYTIKNQEVKKSLLFGDSRLGRLYSNGDSLYICINELVIGDINKTNDLQRKPLNEVYIKEKNKDNVNLYVKTKYSPMNLFIDKDYLYVLSAPNKNLIEVYELNTGKLKKEMDTNQQNIYGISKINGVNYIFGNKNIIKFNSDKLDNIYDINNSNQITTKIN